MLSCTSCLMGKIAVTKFEVLWVAYRNDFSIHMMGVLPQHSAVLVGIFVAKGMVDGRWSRFYKQFFFVSNFF